MSQKPIKDPTVERLDQIIVLLKILNKDNLETIRKKIDEDEIYSKIISVLEGKEIESGKLVEEVIKISDKKERTIQSRISELVDLGVLSKNRQGGKVIYSVSDLFG